MNLIVFDFDSTLMDGETIDFLAKEYNVESEVKEITNKAMKGELDFYESLVKRVSLLKGMELNKVNEICNNLPFNKNAKETISILKDKYKIVCFSGGFNNATISAKEYLGLHGEFSNILHNKNGYLTGLVSGSMCFSNSKGIMLKTLKDIFNFNKIITIGDGANDLSMFKYADIKIAYNAKDILKKEADYCISDLFDIVNILDQPI